MFDENEVEFRFAGHTTGYNKKNIFRGEVDFTVLFSYTTFTSSLQNRSLALVDRHAERNSPLFKIKT